MTGDKSDSEYNAYDDQDATDSTPSEDVDEDRLNRQPASALGATGGDIPGDGAEPDETPAVESTVNKAKRRIKDLIFGASKDEPTHKRCVVIGPPAGGKTQLICSLRRCIAAKSHSYARQFSIMLADHGDEAFRELERLLVQSHRRGLKFEATLPGTCSRPEFVLHVRAPGARGRTYDTRFRIFEGAGGLIERRSKIELEQDPGGKRCRALLEETIEDSDTALICLPIVGNVKYHHIDEINERIGQFILHRRIHSIGVCLTMYERHGLQYGRNAFRVLATRRSARHYMRHAFTHNLKEIAPALEHFHRRRGGGRIWCVPVSSFGFIPNNGGANVSELRYVVGDQWTQDDVLRTIPTPTDDPNLVSHTGELPYSVDTAYQEYWRPFLTIDPFAYIATGHRGDSLIHEYHELGV